MPTLALRGHVTGSSTRIDGCGSANHHLRTTAWPPWTNSVSSEPMASTSGPTNLPALQNLIKRDPLGYEEEFLRRYRHFQSVLELHCQRPTTDSKELIANIGFVSAVRTPAKPPTISHTDKPHVTLRS